MDSKMLLHAMSLKQHLYECLAVMSVERFSSPHKGGASYIAGHGNRPIFSTEFGKIVHILADFGKQEHCRTQNFCIFQDGMRQNFQSY